MWTVRTTLEAAARSLAGRGIEEARLDAELLLAFALGARRLDLYLDRDRPLGEPELSRYRSLLRERMERVPVAYLTGTREFFSLALEVTRDVLVPRPETELVVEAGLRELRRRAAAGEAPAVAADVGTGSGAIVVALAKFGGASLGSAHATDFSERALEVARRNAARHAVCDRIVFCHGDLLAPLASAGLVSRLDLLLSNPPYVAERDRASLVPEVLHEPPEAVFGGEDGLEAIRRIVAGAPALLAPGGLAAIEIGAGQAPAVELLACEAGLAEVRFLKDGAGVDRVLTARRPRL